MADEEKEETDTFVSIMEEFPEYVHAIGMISIELADLEASLADLLAVLLDVDTDMAQALYFSPKVVIPRLEILRNVDEVLHAGGELDEKEVRAIRKKLKEVIKEAQKVMGERNGLLHAAWAAEGDRVYYGTYPLKEGKMAPIALEEIEAVVERIRGLNNDVYELVDLIGVYKAKNDKSDAGDQENKNHATKA